MISRLELELIIQKCDIGILITLLSSGALRIHIDFEILGAGQTPKTNRLNYGMYSIVGIEDLRTMLYMAINKVYRNSYKAGIYTEQLLPFVNRYEQENEFMLGLLAQEKFTSKAFREVIKQDYPDYPIPVDLYYHVHKVDQTNAPAERAAKHTFEVETNFDVSQFERDFAKLKNETEHSAGVNFLLQVGMSIKDIEVASTFQSELSSEDRNQPVIQGAILNLDRYNPSNQKAILDFNSHILDGCPSVAEAIDSGRKSFNDFIKLFEQSRKFRQWLRDVPDDSDHTIVSDYLESCMAPAFTNSLVYKALKFIVVSAPIASRPLLFSALSDETNSAINLVAGPIIDEASSYLLGSNISWRPNQFVDKSLKPFLN